MFKIVYLTVRNFEFFNIRNNKKKFKRLIKKRTLQHAGDELFLLNGIFINGL